MIRPPFLFALALLAAPLAEGAPSCRTDRLGNTICRDPERPRADGPFALPAEPRPPAFIPGWREDAFGTVRPERPPVTGDNPFGEPPRTSPPARCRQDSFGAVRCR